MKRSTGTWIWPAAMAVGLGLLVLGFHQSVPLPAGNTVDSIVTINGTPLGIEEVIGRTGSAELREAAGDEKRLEALLDRAILNETVFQRGLALGLVRKDTLIRSRVVDQVRELAMSEALGRDYGDEELRAYYDKHKALFLRHPRVRISECFLRRIPGRDRQPEIDAIREKAESGADWAEIRRSCEPLPFDLGDRLLDGGALEELFGKAYWSASLGTEIGRVSEPVMTNFGYHVLRIEEREGEEVQPFDEVKQVVIARYRREDTRRALDEYLRTVREEADVAVAPGALARLQRAAQARLAALPTPRPAAR